MRTEQKYSAAVVFDLDDTLFEEIEFLHSGYREVARRLCARYPGLGTYESLYRLMLTAENAFDAVRSRLLAVSPEAKEDQIWMRDVYRYHTPDITLPETSARLLDLLKSTPGVALGLITDGRVTTQGAKIKALGIERWIDPANMIISEAFGSDKRTPLPFQEMMKRLKADRYVYIGDNPAKDIIQPHRLGWSTILLKSGGRNIHPQDGGECADVTASDRRDVADAIFRLIGMS